MAWQGRRGNSPPMPENIGNVTLHQKRNLARLARLGIGPAAGLTPRPSAVLASDSARDEAEDERRPRSRHAGSDRRAALLDAERRAKEAREQEDERRARAKHAVQDRRVALLEAERRAREAEEQAREADEAAAADRKAKARAARAGLKPLGAVLPREEQRPAPGTAYPTPAGGVVPARRMEINISAETVERARVPPVEDDEEDDDDDPPVPGAVPRSVFLPVQRKTDERQREERERQHKSKKKRRRRSKDDSSAGGDASDSENADEDATGERRRKAPRSQSEAADTTVHVPYKEFHVKGQVSRDNQGFTDADLERRFPRDDAGSSGALMSEQQVLAMLQQDRRRTKKDDPAGTATGGSARRAQREAMEWEAMKQQRVQQTGFGKHKDRMVVSGRP